MNESYLELTYRRGRILAAYYYLPRRSGDTSVRAERLDSGLFMDFAADGRPIGIEITMPATFNLEALNAALSRVRQPPAAPDDLAPLVAA